MVTYGLITKSLHNFSIRILFLSYLWAFWKSTFLIIVLPYSARKWIDVKRDSVGVGNLADSWLLSKKKLQWTAELQSSHFALISDINLSLYKVFFYHSIITTKIYKNLNVPVYDVYGHNRFPIYIKKNLKRFLYL